MRTVHLNKLTPANPKELIGRKQLPKSGGRGMGGPRGIFLVSCSHLHSHAKLLVIFLSSEDEAKKKKANQQK